MQVTGRAVTDNADRLTRKVALAVDATVVLATPVDTGRARSNWQAAIGQAPQGTINAYQPGEKQSTAGPNAQAAMEQAKAVIAQYDGGTEIHITNNLPYIGKLNDGHSVQAPAGFVEEAVAAGAAQVAGARLTITNGVAE